MCEWLHVVFMECTLVGVCWTPERNMLYGFNWATLIAVQTAHLTTCSLDSTASRSRMQCLDKVNDIEFPDSDFWMGVWIQFGVSRVKKKKVMMWRQAPEQILFRSKYFRQFGGIRFGKINSLVFLILKTSMGCFICFFVGQNTTVNWYPVKYDAVVAAVTKWCKYAILRETGWWLFLLTGWTRIVAFF